mgnify:FL=1
MTTFQLLAIPSCIMFALIATKRRKDVLTRRQSLVWVFVWLAAAVVVTLPNIASAIAHVVGIGRGADLILYVMCFASILFVRYFYHKQRRLEIALTALVRSNAVQNASAPGRNT